jgi:hypothetical protein
VLDLLSRHKAEVVALLRPGRNGWLAEDWRAFFDERAGIVEFDGGLPRAEAEAHALACFVVEWLNRNPAHSPSGRCLGCGDREHAHDPLLPYGVFLSAFSRRCTIECCLIPNCSGCFSFSRPTMASAVNCGSAASQYSIVTTCGSSLDGMRTLVL